MRIRTIKPEFWRSDDIAALSREHRLLFVGLWSYVDDNGVGIDDHRRIAADLFAFDEDQQEVRDFVRDGVATLSRVLHPEQETPLIVRYEVAGKRYFYVTGWERHQRVDRPGRSRYPLPPDLVTSNDGPDGGPDGGLFATDSREAREELATGTGEQGNRGTGEQEKNTATAGAVAPATSRGAKATKATAAEFEDFWRACPRKVGKGAARKAFDKAARGEPLRDGERRAATLTARMGVWAAHWQRIGQAEQYIPHPATWLNQERYLDPPPRMALVPAQDGATGEGPTYNGVRPSGRIPTTTQRVADTLALKELFPDG